MLGTKWPSITSRWIQSAPAASTARTSSPSLEKSDARIEGAITSGRGAKEADICAVFPKLFRGAKARAFPPNTRSPCRQCGASGCGKICRQRHQLPIKGGLRKRRRLSFHWLFYYGTAFADRYVR